MASACGGGRQPSLNTANTTTTATSTTPATSATTSTSTTSPSTTTTAPARARAATPPAARCPPASTLCRSQLFPAATIGCLARLHATTLYAPRLCGRPTAAPTSSVFRLLLRPSTWAAVPAGASVPYVSLTPRTVTRTTPTRAGHSGTRMTAASTGRSRRLCRAASLLAFGTGAGYAFALVGSCQNGTCADVVLERSPVSSEHWTPLTVPVPSGVTRSRP